tara:strand:+ start:749 stop:934 length:186 start_codon:yes stop_codon:yes gene_type:complete
LDVALLKMLLSSTELDIYSAVVMARQDLETGRLDSAVARLRVDADKIRTVDKRLYDLIAMR